MSYQKLCRVLYLVCILLLDIFVSGQTQPTLQHDIRHNAGTNWLFKLYEYGFPHQFSSDFSHLPTMPVNDPGYGTEWMYFPDGDDFPRRISLDLPPMPMLRQADTFVPGDIEYRLYSRFNVKNYILLNEMGIPLRDKMDPSLMRKLATVPIKLVTHGWESSADKSAVINIKEAYLLKQDVIVIGVDWSSTSENIMYPIVALQTEAVGAQVGEFLNAFCKRYHVSGDQIHLIGHSLGAHVMGNAGQATKYRVSRITGLDPARPLFEFPSRPNSVKLDTSDADFVDVIHTCGGILGIEEPIGHVDFFPNAGLAPQPGCTTIEHFKEACSHSRSHFYFTESILYPNAFPTCKNWTEYLHNQCQKYQFMGDGVNRNTTGNFYLFTNNGIPYGRGTFLFSGITN